MPLPAPTRKKQNSIPMKQHAINNNMVDPASKAAKQVNQGLPKEIQNNLNLKFPARFRKIPITEFRKHGIPNNEQASTSTFYKYHIARAPNPNTHSPASNSANTIDLKSFLATLSDEVCPFILENAILKAISQKSVQILKLVIDPDIEKLDFRGIYFEEREHRVREVEPALVERLVPPNEFDWFAGDVIGKIMSIDEAFQLFSIIRMSKCETSLQELKINARRPTYWTISHNQMNLIIETLGQMNNLTTLILRGMADNIMLQIIGSSCPSLKYLDISFSQYVTDDGILRLFFHNDVNIQSAFYLIPSWIRAHQEKMWPIANSIEYLDCSWTSISSQSRKMLNLISGSYMFKRLFAINENEAYAHHIFVRQEYEWTTPLRMTKNEEEFELKLMQYSGKKGAGCFMKFLSAHPWKSLHLTIFREPINHENKTIVPKAEEKQQHNLETEEAFITTVGVITPSKDEKRIQGLTIFESGNLTQVYSIFPINLNHLGQSCQQLQKLTGTLSDIWKTDFSLFPSLTEINIFAEPNTMVSLLTFCPQLKIIRIRIIRHPITDELLLDALKKSMCRKTLEELWLAPGLEKTGDSDFETIPIYQRKQEEDFQSAGTSISSFGSSMFNPQALGNRNPVTLSSLIPINRNISSYQQIKESIKNDSQIPFNTGSSIFHVNESYIEEIKGLSAGKDIKIADLTQLTINSVKKLFEYCTKLKRLGNFAWWKVTEDEIKHVGIELSQRYSSARKIKLIWDNNIIIPSATADKKTSSSSS